MPTAAETLVRAAAPAAAPLIAIVDDDAVFLEAFAANLRDAGYQVAPFERGAEALAALSSGTPAGACIFDWHMPGLSGLELLRRLRGAGIATPVMFLTSLGQPMFEEVALDQGAVDFVDKTRSLNIILKRLALILDRPAGPAPAPVQSVVEVGALGLRLATKRASWQGVPVPLSVGEFDVVALLASRAGADVAYREIYDVVRGEGFIAGSGEDGYRANVRAIVKRVRRKFSDLDPAFDALENYSGFGYRWRAP